MGSINSQGVYEYDDTEMWAPQDDYQNLQAAALTAALADIRAEIAALGTLVDSDWVTIAGSTGGALGTGWSATTGHPPRVRKVGDRVDIAGAVTLTGSGTFADLLTMPEGFRLVGAYVNYFIGSVVATTGEPSSGVNVDLLLSGTTHKVSVPDGYRDGALTTGDVVPLIGSYYIN